MAVEVKELSKISSSYMLLSVMAWAENYMKSVKQELLTQREVL